jgi:hypothetical protein
VLPVGSPFRSLVSQHLDLATFPAPVVERPMRISRTTLSCLLRDQVLWDLSCRSGFHLWPTHAIAVEQLQRVIEPGPTDLRRYAMWPVGRHRGARIQPWHFEVARHVRPTFQPRRASTPNNQCREECKRRDAARGERGSVAIRTPSAAPHGTRMTFPWCPGAITASWLRAAWLIGSSWAITGRSVPLRSPSTSAA